jgi:hypothetical protein
MAGMARKGSERAAPMIVVLRAWSVGVVEGWIGTRLKPVTFSCAGSFPGPP